MKALFLGSHCDDVDLGCGATIHKHRTDWDIQCAVLCNLGYFDGTLKNIQSIATRSLNNLGVKNVLFGGFHPDEFIHQRQKIWVFLSEINKNFAPDIVVVQSPDEHPDHKILNQECIRIFRHRTILEYHVTRSEKTHECDTFECVSRDNIDAKLRSAEIYGEIYKNKNYLEKDNVLAQLKFTGIYPGLDNAEGYKTITRIGI